MQMYLEFIRVLYSFTGTKQGSRIWYGCLCFKDVPDNAVAVGNPVKVVKYLDAEKFNKATE